MTRLGWWLLLLFAAVIAGFALIVRRGGYTAQEPAPVQAPAASDSSGPLVIPVTGVSAGQLTDTWGDARGDGTSAHHAIDIMAVKGTPVVVAASGVIEKIFESAAGGHTVYVRVGPATIHYYAHLDSYAPELAEGMRVGQGQLIGTVGSTGDANPDGPHLHFEIKRMAAGEKWYQGKEIDPYPILAGKAAAR